MPIIKSAIKRAKQSLTRRSRNLQTKRAVKQDVQALHAAIAEGTPEEVQVKLNEAYSEIDRAVRKGTFHKNTAARRKSQLAVAVTKAVNTDPEEAKATTTTKGAGKAAASKKATATKKPAAKKAPVEKKIPAEKKAPAKKPAAKATESKADKKADK
jgi:small subunit ribosomal protein S20